MILLLGLALGATVAAAYYPVLSAQFVSWDDDLHVVGNVHVRGLSAENVRWAFTTIHADNWIPLTWLSHALDGQLYGLDPAGHHATSLLLHIANTIVVFLVLRSLTGAVGRSAVVAGLFGLHPLHVESVAWVSERKDVLSALFWLLAMGAYARYARRPTGGRYAWVGLAFVAALLAKPMAVTLPFALLLLDYWPLERLSWRAVVEKVPLLVAAIACSLAALGAQNAGGATRSLAKVGLADRIANALVSYVRYLGLTVWPVRLSPWYSHPADEGPPLAHGAVLLAVLFLVAVSALVLATARRRPHLVVGWLWYLGTLLPVIGLVQVGFQGMADRYTYLPLLGVFIAVVWELDARLESMVPKGRRLGAAIAVVALAGLAVATTRQAQVWHDSRTLWTTTRARNPRASIAHFSLGNLDLADGHVEAAIQDYRRAVKLRSPKPDDYVNAHRVLAGLLVGSDRLAAAAAHYRKALAASGAPEDHNDLANVLEAEGNSAAARRHLERALRLRPAFAEAHNNLGILFANDGKLSEAVAEFRAALRLRPDFAAAQQNLAAVLADQAHEASGGDVAP